MTHCRGVEARLQTPDLDFCVTCVIQMLICWIITMSPDFWLDKSCIDSLLFGTFGGQLCFFSFTLSAATTNGIPCWFCAFAYKWLNDNPSNSVLKYNRIWLKHSLLVCLSMCVFFKVFNGKLKSTPCRNPPLWFGSDLGYKLQITFWAWHYWIHVRFSILSHLQRRYSK